MSARQIRVGDIVRSKITGRTGPVLRVEQYDDGTPRITAELTKGYDTGAPSHHFELVRSADDGRVHDIVEAERQASAVEDEGQPSRPFQVGDEVLVDGEPGVIAEMCDDAVRVDSTQALVEMTGFPFPAGDAVALSADRTRPVDGRQIELVRPAPTGRISSQAGLASIRHGVVPMDDASAEDRIVAILTDHYDLRWRQDERMHCKADCGYSVDAESATVDHVRRHQAALILAALGGAS